MSRLLVASALVVCALGASARAAVVVFQHDQFSADIATAATELSGMSLAPHPGFAQGEAFGQIYHPAPGQYPVRLLSVDVIAAAPPAGGIGGAHGEIEIWAVDGAGPRAARRCSR